MIDDIISRDLKNLRSPLNGGYGRTAAGVALRAGKARNFLFVAAGTAFYQSSQWRLISLSAKPQKNMIGTPNPIYHAYVFRNPCEGCSNYIKTAISRILNLPLSMIAKL
ncbi:MAG: hypothetical protein ACRD3W_26600 [Terriglobales bacterium]